MILLSLELSRGSVRFEIPPSSWIAHSRKTRWINSQIPLCFASFEDTCDTRSLSISLSHTHTHLSRLSLFNLFFPRTEYSILKTQKTRNKRLRTQSSNLQAPKSNPKTQDPNIQSGRNNKFKNSLSLIFSKKKLRMNFQNYFSLSMARFPRVLRSHPKNQGDNKFACA